jgi:hypothetical protein
MPYEMEASLLHQSRQGQQHAPASPSIRVDDEDMAVIYVGTRDGGEFQGW